MLLSYKLVTFRKRVEKNSVWLIILSAAVVMSCLSSAPENCERALHVGELHASISCMYACMRGCVCVSACLRECICMTIHTRLSMYKYARMWFNMMHAWLRNVHMTTNTCQVTIADDQPTYSGSNVNPIPLHPHVSLFDLTLEGKMCSLTRCVYSKWRIGWLPFTSDHK